MAKLKLMEFVISKVSLKKYPNVYKNILTGSKTKQSYYYILNGGMLGVFKSKEDAKKEVMKIAKKGVKGKRPIKIYYD